MQDYTEQLIGGWRPGKGPVFESIDPYTQTAWARHTEATDEDVDEAVSCAEAAFESWRRTSGYDRGKLLVRIADLLERDIDRLAEIETRDNGKLLRENRGQLAFAAREYRFCAGYADKLGGQSHPLDTATTVDFSTREPLGVCVLVTAWNAPLQLLANKLPQALAAGNSVVIKPSEFTSASTLAFGRLLEEAGCPAGLVNIVTGGAETGRALTSHQRIAKIGFTGGGEAARHIAANAAKNLVPAIFELGGKSANIVFPDADMRRAIPGAVSGIFAAAGQTCVAGSRLLVHEDIYDTVVDAVVERAAAIIHGNPMDPETQVGPMAHRAQHDRVRQAIGHAVDEGARLVAGGAEPAGMEGTLFMAPTIFRDVTNNMAIAQKEVFGPVLSIIRFSTDDEAVAIANDSQFGLVAGVWTQDITRALTVGKELRVGTIWTNMYRAIGVQAPFGGFKNSGYGREHGLEGILEYTATKNTMIDLSSELRDPFVLGVR